MAIKETVFLLLVLMLPVAMMAKEPVKHSREIGKKRKRSKNRVYFTVLQ